MILYNYNNIEVSCTTILLQRLYERVIFFFFFVKFACVIQNFESHYRRVLFSFAVKREKSWKFVCFAARVDIIAEII